MKLSDEAKQKIEEEYETFKEHQYANNTKEQRDDLGQFFTPPSIIFQMLEAVSWDEFGDKTILDPTCGAGGLLVACIFAGANPKCVYGNELDENILKVCKERLLPLGVPEENLHCGNALNEDCIKLGGFVKTYKWDPRANKVTGIEGTMLEDLW